MVWQKDLPLNGSRYDWNHAKADPDFLHTIWLTWMVVAEVAALASAIVIVGVLHSKKARRNVFNIYIVFLCLPDFIFSSLCAITCALCWWTGAYYGGTLGCKWQSFYVVFGFAGSMWMQAVIAAEIRHVLRCSHEQRAYVQPKMRQALRRAGAVYAMSLCLACWTVIDFLPIHADAASGMACLPLAYSLASEIFLWLAFLGVGAFAPLAGASPRPAPAATTTRQPPPPTYLHFLPPQASSGWRGTCSPTAITGNSPTRRRSS